MKAVAMTVKTKKPKLTRNAVRCLGCNDVIESKYRHDFRTCSCGGVHVDGGLDYTKRGWRPGAEYEELAEYDDGKGPILVQP